VALIVPAGLADEIFFTGAAATVLGATFSGAFTTDFAAVLN
jgi:hypothetical protein